MKNVVHGLRRAAAGIVRAGAVMAAGVASTAAAVRPAHGRMRVRTLAPADTVPQAFPVAGFMFKQRDFANPGLNFAHGTEHLYLRQAPGLE